MKVWFIENDKPYSRFVKDSITTLQDVDEVNCLSEDEVLDNLTYSLLSELENSIELTILVDVECTDFLFSLQQIVSRMPFRQEKVKVVIFSGMLSWMSYQRNSKVSDLGSCFFARKPNPSCYEEYAIENAFSQLEGKRKIRSNLVLLGALYGKDGIDFKNTFKQIWQRKIAITPEAKQEGKIIPSIHYARFQEILLSVLSRENSYGYLVPAFDFSSVPLVEIVNEIYNRVNLSTTENNNLIAEETSSERWFGPWEKKQVSGSTPWALNLAELFHRIKPNPDSPNILSNFDSVWKEFLESNGFKRVNLVTIGGPKTGKTILSKQLAEKLQIEYVDVLSSVLALLNWNESILLPPDVDQEKVTAAKGEVKIFFENKLAEGKKPSKDKNAPVEPPQLDMSLVNDALCLTLPAELVKSALAYRLSTDNSILKKGYILDIWERNILDTLAELTVIESQLKTSDSATGADAACPVDAVIEIMATEKMIIDKQIEIIGPANMKSKDSQATIKSLEAAVAAYFGATVQLDETEANASIPFPQKTHTKLKSFQELFSGAFNTFRIEFSTISQVDEHCFQLRNDLSERRGTVFSWLDTIASAGSNVETSEERTVETSVDASPSTSTAAPSSSSQNKETHIWKNSIPGVNKYDEFLTATLLPVLSRGIIDAIRHKPEDPILYVAEYLAEVSKRQQLEAYEAAKRQFEELLKS